MAGLKTISGEPAQSVNGRVKTVGLLHEKRSVTPRSRSFVAWAALFAIFFPSIEISIGDVKFTPARMAVILLIIPSLMLLFRKGRRGNVSDVFAVTTAGWMILASILNGGFRAYVVAEALEFLGAYLMGRTFFFGISGIQTFISALKVIMPIVIAIAFLDTLSGKIILYDWSATANKVIVGGDVTSNYRFGLARAASTLESAELYGTVCVAAAAIFLYSEYGLSRVMMVGISIFGSVLSLSSGPMLGLAIVVVSCFYDRIFKNYVWRWRAAGLIFIGIILTIFLIKNEPVIWIISHVTINPQTGYFRLGTWDLGLAQIDQSPFIGRGFKAWSGGSDVMLFLAQSIDCLWLLEAIRYGIPVVIFLLITIFAPFIGARRNPTLDTYVNRLRIGFSLAILTMCFVGLTVHYWNSTWILFSLCIGIRASFAEIVDELRHKPSPVPASIGQSYFLRQRF